MTILLIDDEPIAVKMLQSTLQKTGYRVLIATNGPQGRKLATKNQPDIILLDVMMPGEDGFDVLRLLKKDPRTANIPVIFLTGRGELDAKMTGFDLGAIKTELYSYLSTR